MARHGENIRKRKDGRWEGRYLVYDQKKEKQVYCSVYGRTYDEVREKLVAKKYHLKKQYENNTKEHEPKIHILKNIFLTNAAQEWLENIKEKRKNSTYVKYSLIYKKYIEKIGNLTLSEVTDSYVKQILDDTLSDSVCKSIYCVLNQILKYTATQYSLIVVSLKKPNSRICQEPVKALSKSEQKKLIETLYQRMDLFKVAVLMSLFTGLRLGELCGLKWSDIDFENKTLTIRRTVQRLYANGYNTKTILMETPPKSLHSRREIPLSDMVMELLQKFHNNTEYVFGGNKPLEPRTLQYQFKKILNEAGLQGINFHILRHTFFTNCIEGGADVKSLSEILGHSNVQITLNRYVHPSIDTKRRYMQNLARFYGQIYGQVG